MYWSLARCQQRCMAARRATGLAARLTLSCGLCMWVPAQHPCLSTDRGTSDHLISTAGSKQHAVAHFFYNCVSLHMHSGTSVFEKCPFTKLDTNFSFPFFPIYPTSKKKKKERRGNIVISDKNLYSKNVQEPTLFARGGEKMRLQPGNCNRLSLIHAFQYSYYKTIRNINVSLCIEVTNVIYTDIPVP